MGKSNSNSNEILYVFIDYEASDIDKLEASLMGKLYLFSSRYSDTKALIYNYSFFDIPDTEKITYLRYSMKLGRVKAIAVLAIARMINNRKPGIVVMSGAPTKVDLRFMFRLLCPKQKFAIIMATPCVSRIKWMRWYQNSMLKFNLLFFKNILITKNWRFDRMSLPKKKLKYFELGYYDFGFEPKDFTEIKLVYLGVFSGRGIENTIKGLAIFHAKNTWARISYDIIGKDTPDQASFMNETIKELNLSDIVRYHGFLPQDDVARIIRSCNVGVSYLPNNGIYGYTSTKTIEYLIAGLPVISTSSLFKDQYINDSNGIIHEDNPEAFAWALETMYCRRFGYDPNEIRKKHQHLSLESKIRNSLVPLLETLIYQK